MPRYLVVGAGAVGLSYGLHARLGGAEVRWLAKPEHLEHIGETFALYPLNADVRRRLGVSEARTPYETSADCVSTVQAAAAFDPNVILVTVSSPALRAPWLKELAAACPAATWVILQSGLMDRAFVAEHVHPSRIVTGLISLVAYVGPLPGETLPRPGVAYWFPPFTPLPFDGEAAQALKVVETLRQGGAPARLDPNAVASAPYASAMLMPAIVGLELADWSLSGFASSPWSATAAAATRELFALLPSRVAVAPPTALRLAARRGPLQMLARLAPKFTPLDLETYLRVHFTKVGDQTRGYLKDYLALSETLGIPVPSVAALAHALGDRDATITPSTATAKGVA